MEAHSLKPTNLKVNDIQSQEKSSCFPGAPTKQTSSFHSSVTCYCCGNVGHLAKDPRCPDEDMSCNNCHKLGHFAQECRHHDQRVSLKIKTVKIYLEMKSTNKRLNAIVRYIIFPVCHFLRPGDAPLMTKIYSKMPHAILGIGDVPINLIVDSSVTVNILDIPHSGT